MQQLPNHCRPTRYTLCPKKHPPFYFSNNFLKNLPILMIFGVLNPEKIWHQKLVLLPTSHIYCSHFTLGNSKSHFSTVLFIRTSDYLRYLRRKQTVTPLPPHLKNVTALPCKMHKFFIFFIFSRVSRTNLRHGRVEEALRHGLNFSRAWWTMQLISGEKTESMYPCRRWSLNTCCNVACLTFHLPHITTGSFQSH